MNIYLFSSLHFFIKIINAASATELQPAATHNTVAAETHTHWGLSRGMFNGPSHLAFSITSAFVLCIRSSVHWITDAYVNTWILSLSPLYDTSLFSTSATSFRFRRNSCIKIIINDVYYSAMWTSPHSFNSTLPKSHLCMYKLSEYWTDDRNEFCMGNADWACLKIPEDNRYEHS